MNRAAIVAFLISFAATAGVQDFWPSTDDSLGRSVFDDWFRKNKQRKPFQRLGFGLGHTILQKYADFSYLHRHQMYRPQVCVLDRVPNSSSSQISHRVILCDVDCRFGVINLYVVRLISFHKTSRGNRCWLLRHATYFIKKSLLSFEKEAVIVNNNGTWTNSSSSYLMMHGGLFTKWKNRGVSCLMLL